MKGWITFAKERFSPGAYVPMILLFVVATAYSAPAAMETPLLTGFSLDSVVLFGALIAGVTAFFFKLRVYDEIKDYETDQTLHPDRPLPRGVITLKQAFEFIFLALAVELTAFAVLGPYALLSLLVPLVYSILMYKEFFLGRFLRKHLTTYAVTHTFVSFLLTLAVISAVSNTLIWDLGTGDMALALNVWCLFNIFEFGRKTYAESEERPDVDTYSSIFGRYGAVLLTLSQAVISLAALYFVLGAAWAVLGVIGAAVVALAGLGFLYARKNEADWASFYRNASSAYLMVILGTLAVFSMVNRF